MKNPKFIVFRLLSQLACSGNKEVQSSNAWKASGIKINQKIEKLKQK